MLQLLDCLPAHPGSAQHIQIIIIIIFVVHTYTRDKLTITVMSYHINQSNHTNDKVDVALVTVEIEPKDIFGSFDLRDSHYTYCKK